MTSSIPLHSDRRRNRGFTLVEMVVVMVIIGIIASVGALVLKEVFSTFFAGEDINRGDWQGRVAMERMSRELRDIRFASAADLPTIGANTIRFFDVYGNDITYALSGTTLNRTQAPTGAQPLADNVSALAFTYLDQTGTGTAVAANVYYIQVQATVTATATGTTSTVFNATYRTTVKPRNF